MILNLLHFPPAVAWYFKWHLLIFKWIQGKSLCTDPPDPSSSSNTIFQFSLSSFPIFALCSPGFKARWELLIASLADMFSLWIPRLSVLHACLSLWSTWRVCFQLSPSVPRLPVQLDPVQGEHSLDFLGHKRVLPPFVSETESLHGRP